MKLYYSPAVCSMAVHVALNEIGVPFETQLVDLKKGEHKKEDYLKINPRAQVAALEVDEGIITENVAIITYLDEKHPEIILPKSGYARAIAMQWLLFANTSLHGAYSKFMFALRNGGDDKIKQAALDHIQDQWDEIERHLNDCKTDYLAGDKLTAGDIYTAVVANWSFISKMPEFGPKTQELINKVSSTPSFQKTLDNEGVDYKVAA